MENINDFLEQATKSCGYCVKFDDLLDWAKINVIKEYAELAYQKQKNKMEKEIKITGCYYSCTFFGNSMDGMVCNHPYWKDKGAYENMIITQDNSRDGKIPEKCPLKNEQINIVYKLDIS
jgi:hypothetical protein